MNFHFYIFENIYQYVIFYRVFFFALYLGQRLLRLLLYCQHLTHLMVELSYLGSVMFSKIFQALFFNDSSPAFNNFAFLVSLKEIICCLSQIIFLLKFSKVSGNDIFSPFHFFPFLRCSFCLLFPFSFIYLDFKLHIPSSLYKVLFLKIFTLREHYISFVFSPQPP